jgi:hypothetical protein
MNMKKEVCEVIDYFLSFLIEYDEKKTHNDAFLSPLLNPLEGSTMSSCGKLGLGGRSRLPALKGVEGRARSPGI